MELNQFIVNFASQMDDTDPSEITAETMFHDLADWNSLTALSVISMIDDEYDVIIKGDDLNKSKTVVDLFEVVKSKK